MTQRNNYVQIEGTTLDWQGLQIRGLRGNGGWRLVKAVTVQFTENIPCDVFRKLFDPESWNEVYKHTQNSSMRLLKNNLTRKAKGIPSCLSLPHFFF